MMLCWLAVGAGPAAWASADRLSLQSAEMLANSLMAALPDTMPTERKQALRQILYSPDDKAISASSLQAMTSLLPLPAATILRLTASFERQLPVNTGLSSDSAIAGFNSATRQRSASPQFHRESLRLALYATVKQLVWRAALSPDQLNQVPSPPVPPSMPVPPIPPASIASGLVAPSVSFLSPLTTAAIATGAAAATAGLAQSSSDNAALASQNASSGDDSGSGDNGNGGNGGDVPENLDTAIWETVEYTANYGLASLHASTAYARGYTGQGVTVSVLDSPFDTDHADLIDNFVTGYDALEQDSTVHCPVNGCVSAHGTHVAGIIGAVKNDIGMHGVAPDVAIKPVKVFDNDLSFANNDQLVDAIAQGSGVAITAMNNSWGTGVTDTLVHNNITYYYNRPFYNYADNGSTEYIYAYQGATALRGLPPAEITAWQNASQNTIIVFANGNDGLNTATGQIRLFSDNQLQNYELSVSNASSGPNANIPSFRGSYPVIDSSLTGEWLTVVAVDQSNLITEFSNGCGYAKAFCIAAPGASIYATYDVDDNTTSPPASYANLDGTSMAAPHVTGAIALLKQQFPNLTPAQLTSLVLSTATDLGAVGIDDIYGVGLLNLAEASRPQGSLAVAGINGQRLSGLSPQNTSITPSPVFGQAFANRLPTIGLVDGYDRVFDFQPQLGKAQEYEVSAEALLALLETSDPSEERLISSGYLSVSVAGDMSDDSLSVSLYNRQMRFEAGRQTGISSDLLRLRPIMSDTGLNRYFAAPKSVFTQLSFDKTDFSYLHSDFALTPALSLQMAHIRGSWQNGGQFDELSSQIGWQEARAGISGKFGLLRESATILGARLSGFYEPASDIKSQFASVGATMAVSATSQLTTRYLAMQTSPDMKQAGHVSIDGLRADSYALALDRWSKRRAGLSQQFAIRLPLATTGGFLSQLTTRGYQNGSYRTVFERYALANENRQLDIDMHHQDRLWPGALWMFRMYASHNVAGIRNRQDAGLFVGVKQKF